MRISSVLTSRHLSQSRIRLPARKYHPENRSSMVSFFSDEEETTRTPKAYALFIPMENPRALVIHPLETWPRKASVKKPKGVSSPAQTNGKYTQYASTSHQNGCPTDNGNGNHSENGFFKEQPSPVKITQKSNGLHEDQSTSKSDSYISLTGHRAGEAAIVYEHGADIEALMPKLRHSDYYTEPRVQELAAKERAEPGFCRRVKYFTVGHHNYGSIKLLGETDVRRLNKPAEVTLLNIKCSDKKTGKHFTEGRRVEKYKKILKRKAEDQGAEFVSYDPIKGEWKYSSLGTCLQVRPRWYACEKSDFLKSSSCLYGYFMLNFAMRKSLYLLVSPTLALHSSLEHIVTTYGRGLPPYLLHFLGQEGVQCLLCSRWPCGNLITVPTSLGGFNFRFRTHYERLLQEISVGKKVDIGMGGGHGKLLRPTDLSLYSCDVRIDVSVDLTRSSPLKQMGMTDFVHDHIGRSLIDVYAGELTLRVNNEAVTFNLDQTLRYSSNYNDMMANRIDVIDMACEEYSQEVLGFSDVIVSGNHTPYYDLIISTSSPTLTPFKNSDFLLEEVDAFLALEDDLTSPEVDHFYFDTEGDILLLEAFLNDDPSLPHTTQGMYFPQGDDKFPVIIAKDLSIKEKDTLIKVLKSHKQDIAWKLSDIKGIDLEFCTHKILMEDKFEPAVQHQRKVNPKIHDVIRKEVLKLLNAGLIYPISDSPWGGVYALTIELNEATRKDHFPLTFMDQMLERLSRNEYYCFLDGFSSYFQIPIDTKDQEKTTFTCPYRTHQSLSKLGESHFMVKEGIVLDHKISKNGIEVDKAKVDIIAKLPHPTTVKGIRSFLCHVNFYRRFIQDFSKIARLMTRLLEKDTSFFFSNECIEAFQTLKRKLTKAPILVAPDWDLSLELMCDASDFSIVAVLGDVLLGPKPKRDVLAYMASKVAKVLVEEGSLKRVTIDSVTPKVLAPGMYVIDVELIPLHLRNNREVHLDYLKHLKESIKTLCEIVEEAKALTKEIKEIKDVFEELEAEVAQNVVDRKHDEIERKNLLIANDNLIAECLSKEVFFVSMNFELNVARFTKMHVANTIVEAYCLELEAELSNLRDKSHNDNHDENNREVHLDYLKHLKESIETLCEIVEEAKVERPLDRSLASACLYTKHSQKLLEYMIGTCPKDFNKRDKKQD
nr:nuclear pore complex protein NUP98A-like [Tanacetum cinerariifolium]